MKLKHTRRLFVRLLPAGPRGVLLLFETLWQCISIFIYREAAFWVFFVSSLSSKRGVFFFARESSSSLLVFVKEWERDSVVMCHPKKLLSLSRARAYRWVAQQKFAELLLFGFLRRLSLNVALAEECVLFYIETLWKTFRNTHNFFRPPHVACEKFFPKEGLLRVLLQSSPLALGVSQISPRDLKRHANIEREKTGAE